jgi:hypothetical protein
MTDRWSQPSAYRFLSQPLAMSHRLTYIMIVWDLFPAAYTSRLTNERLDRQAPDIASELRMGTSGFFA